MSQDNGIDNSRSDGGAASPRPPDATPGLSLEEHNSLKYSVAVRRVGQAVLSSVFAWGYQHPRDPIKSALLALPGFTMTRYRKEFNASQRQDLESNGSPACVGEFDITLAYKVLQLVCGLQEPSHPDWVTAASNSLEYCLYSIKSHRNELAHKTIRLNPQELNRKIEELSQLFDETLQRAKQRYGVDDSRVSPQVDLVTSELERIRDSPVPPTSVAEYERERRAMERASVAEECWGELGHMAQGIALVDIAGNKVNVASVFTPLRLRRDETHILQRQLTVEESHVDVSDILDARECDQRTPQIVLLSALSGMGKSTILKYLLDRSYNDKNAVKSLDDYDTVMYLQCRNVTMRTTDHLLALLLPRTFSKYDTSTLQQHVLDLNILLLLDDVESLDKQSFGVIEDFCRQLSPKSKVILTVSRERAKEIQGRFTQQHKLVLYLQLKGVSEENTFQHIKNVIQHGMKDTSLDRDREQELKTLISSKRPCLQDHLCSPEVLTALSICWTMFPDRINTSTTVTEIFILIQEMIGHKVLQNITSSFLPSLITKALVKSKLAKFLETLSTVAAKSLVRGSCKIDHQDLFTLIKKCKKLELEEESLICSFLNYIDSEEDAVLGVTRQVSFPQQSTMYYYSAIFLVRHCARRSTSLLDGLQLKPDSVNEQNGFSFQSTIKYLLGLLSVHLPQRLRERAGEIVSLLKKTGVKKASQWIQYIDEAKEEATITRHILEEMKDNWEVEDFAISSTLCNILRMKCPTRMTLTVCEDPNSLLHLSQVLSRCAAVPTLTLSLHLYNHFWSEKVDTSDKYLDLVVGSCAIEHFAGRLSAAAIPRLPVSLQRLALHVTPAMIPHLNQHLDNLTQLQMLYLNLDASPDVPPSLMPQLNHGEETDLSVDIWKVTEASVEWACDVAQALSKSYARLVLRDSTLGEQGCMAWLEGLARRGVAAPWMVVGSCHALDDQGLERLKSLAQTTVNCSKFVWLKV